VDTVKKFMQKEALFLKGGLNLLRLGALLRRASIFISNDSGPVHIASAVGTPVISIFGRGQPGLSPGDGGRLRERYSYS